MLRKVVSNTTPIISLQKIGQLHVLQELYGRIIIPYEVYSEVEAGREKPFYTDLSKIQWFDIQRIRDEKSLSYFLDLDRGEAEAIVLANEISADLILLDETLGRFHAKHIGLKLTGTIGILIKAKQEGVIKLLGPLLLELRSKDVWLSDRLIKEALTLAAEI